MTPAMTLPTWRPMRRFKPPNSRFNVADVLVHRQRHRRHRGEMVRIRLDQSAGDHVGVADGLDLLQPVLAGELVEAGEDAIQQLDQLGGRAAASTAA